MQCLFAIYFFFILNLSLFSDSCKKGDCQNGKGIKLFTNGNSYEGDFKNGVFDGFGIFTSAKGTKYLGQFKNGKKNGFGTLTFEGILSNSKPSSKNEKSISVKKIRYEGEWKENRKEGNGKLTIENNGKRKLYLGYFNNGKLDGMGFLETDSAKYEGRFKKNRLNGQGIYINKDGEKYVGEFLNHKFDGKGTFTFKDGSIYIGDFKLGKFHGKGRLFNHKNKVTQAGRWEKGEFKR